MATYEQIKERVKEENFFTPKTCWIADVKRKCGLPVKKAHNRKNGMKNPCPQSKFEDIKKALKYFRMI